MNKILLLPVLTTLLLTTGCSTTTVPTTLKPHPEKYALQIVRIEAPAGSTHISEPKPAFSISQEEPGRPATIEDLLNNPDATVYELPIVYAAVGETAINDQTETITFPDIDEPAKIGQYVELTLHKVEDGKASCDLDFFDQSLIGMQEMGAVSMPIFKKNGMKTKVSLTPGRWVSMGGLSAAKYPALTTDRHLFIRILSPQK